MKRGKIISLLLGLSLLCTTIIPGNTAYAAPEDSTDKGMVVSKTAKANEDGTYTIQLEAYATGSKLITEESKDVPTDIVLVLDQSGSMKNDIGEVSFRAYTNKENKSHYEKRHNNNSGKENLYYRLEDGSYASVSVTCQKTGNYEQLGSLANYKTSYRGDISTDCYYYYANNLYEKVGEEYKQVQVSQEQNNYRYSYTYTFSDGTRIVSDGNNSSPDFGTHAPLYALTGVNEEENVYTYTYTDANGDMHTIDISIGASTTFSTTLYERTVSTSGGGSRLSALKTAVTTFANSVATKAAGKDGRRGTADDINHRIAVVGFASQSEYGNNTELLSISGGNSGSVGVAYNNITKTNYTQVLQSMNTNAGITMVNSAINALDAQGATQTNLGVTMAKKIFENNPVSTDEKRNRVVIVFSDGSPTSWTGFELNVANNAISQANTIKAEGITVYSVGIFSGADASSAGTQPSRSLSEGDSAIPAASNWFMQTMSSNNGTPKTPSYYLSAADATTLNNIFQQISDQIEEGGSSTTLNSQAVIKDIISPQFTLPEGATANNITLETYSCTGKNGETYTWVKNADAMDATATVVDDQVSVTGFDFAGNYVGTITQNGIPTYRGNKLVISFNVEPKDDFLGGNDVYTNASAGVYTDSTAETPVIEFERPQVNVPIDNITVNAEDKNVYLLGDITAAQLTENATANVGDVALDLTKANDTEKPYGLEPWQIEYVDISMIVYDDNKTGDIPITGFSDLTEDEKYGVKIIVSPKKDGTDSDGKPAISTFGKAGCVINVFKPELTYKDGEVWYGANVPTQEELGANLQTTKWAHSYYPSGSPTSVTKYDDDTDVTMLGKKPDLTMTYTPEASMIVNNKINTKQDIPVDVTVKIGETDVTQYTTFQHTDCDGKTCTVPEGKEFLLHVKTCSLTIIKNGGAAGEPYVFDIYKDGQPYTQATIVGPGQATISELPVGTYSIAEEIGWSWRYAVSYGNNVTLSSSHNSDSITCTNERNKDSWLNGYSSVKTNIAGEKH